MSSLWSSFPCATLIWVAQFGAPPPANGAVIVRESGAFFAGLFNKISQFPIDFDGNGTDDVALYTDLYAYQSSGAYAIGAGSGIFALSASTGQEDLGSLAAPVRFGEMISTLSEPWSSYGALWGEDFVDPLYGRAGASFYGIADRGIIGAPPLEAGYWRPGDRFACGIRFLGNDGLYHYGWIDVNMNSVTSLTIYGWAYETEPNVFVTPFQIPEPEIGFLCMLAGCLFIFKRSV